jgi:hypothetical protein
MFARIKRYFSQRAAPAGEFLQRHRQVRCGARRLVLSGNRRGVPMATPNSTEPAERNFASFEAPVMRRLNSRSPWLLPVVAWPAWASCPHTVVAQPPLPPGSEPESHAKEANAPVVIQGGTPPAPAQQPKPATAFPKGSGGWANATHQPLGWVSGVIRWKTSLGTPISPKTLGWLLPPKTPVFDEPATTTTSSLGADWGYAFAISAYYQEVPLAAHVGSGARSVGVIAACTYLSQSNGDYVMGYTLTQVPLGMPRFVRVSLSGRLAWKGVPFGASTRINPDGWRGPPFTLNAPDTVAPASPTPPLVLNPGSPIPPPAGDKRHGGYGVSGVNFRMLPWPLKRLIGPPPLDKP